jgi:hypothetical protein
MTKPALNIMAEQQFGDMVKAVVDIVHCTPMRKPFS